MIRALTSDEVKMVVEMIERDIDARGVVIINRLDGRVRAELERKGYTTTTSKYSYYGVQMIEVRRGNHD